MPDFNTYNYTQNYNLPYPNNNQEDADLIENLQKLAEATDTALGGKVGEETGKGLSENDFTDALKNKLENDVEVTSNKKNVLDDSETFYPSNKAVKDVTDALDARVDLLESLESMSDLTWEQVAEIVAQGKAKNYFKVGDEFLEDWAKVISGTRTEYANTPINVAHIGNYKNSGDETKEGMYLEWKYCTPDGLAFCEPQALQIFDGTEGTPSGLPAGNYCFYVDSLPNWSTARPVYAGKYLCFTLNQAIPAGGLLRGKGQTISNAASGWMLQSRTSDQSNATTIEDNIALTPQASIPSGYINLGTCWGTDIGYGILNWIECVPYGDNTWRDSDLRQWLNSNAVAGSWWTKKTRYNIQPAYARTHNGFLYGYSDDFVSQMKTVKVGTYTNIRKEKEGLVITEDKIFLRSNAQANCTCDDADQDNITTYPEGEPWDYYKALAVGESNLDSKGRFKTWQTYAILISYQLGSTSSAVTCWNRSPIRNNGNSERIINGTGTVAYYSAYAAGRCRPACVI